MSFIDDEIALQPQAWRTAVTTARAAVAVLPTPGERVAVVGCGTSWFMAQAYAVSRESRGGGITDAFAASAFPHDRRYDRIVAITRSGTTTEVLDLLARQRGRTPTTALTADLTTPVVDAADHVVDLSYADESSVVQTVFATTALAMLRAHLGDDVAALADELDTALTRPLDPQWSEAEQLTFLGHGWAHGIAREAALKMREACQSWTESYPTMEYRHGPVAIAAPGRVVWHFGSGAGSLGAELAATGAWFVDQDYDPMVDLTFVHRLSAELAVRRGLDPDRPRNLTRSVVLSS